MAQRPEPVRDLDWSPERATELGESVVALWGELLGRLRELPVNREFDQGEIREALYRRAMLDALMATSRAPADWHRFVGHVLACEDDWHGGSAGVADSAFYAPVLRYMSAVRAPGEAVAAVRFARGLAAYDWAEARGAGDVLLAAYARGDQWVDTGMLHDGGVVAALQTGDPAAARRAMAATRARLRRGAEDVRGPLLAAWVDAAERGGRGRAPGGAPGRATPVPATAAR